VNQQLFLLGLNSLKLWATVVAAAVLTQPWRLDGSNAKAEYKPSRQRQKSLR